MTDTHEAQLVAPLSQVEVLLEALKPLGRADLLEGLPTNASEKQIMGRLVEAGASLAEGSGPTRGEFEVYAVVTPFLSPEAASYLNERIDTPLYDASAPGRKEALQVRAEHGDIAAQKTLEREEAAARPKIIASEITTQIRGCCEGQNF